jgi:hypothetical protein
VRPTLVEQPRRRPKPATITHLERALAEVRAANAVAPNWDERPAGLMAEMYRAELDLHEALRVARSDL